MASLFRVATISLFFLAAHGRLCLGKEMRFGKAAFHFLMSREAGKSTQLPEERIVKHTLWRPLRD